MGRSRRRNVRVLGPGGRDRPVKPISAGAHAGLSFGRRADENSLNDYARSEAGREPTGRGVRFSPVSTNSNMPAGEYSGGGKDRRCVGGLLHPSLEQRPESRHRDEAADPLRRHVHEYPLDEVLSDLRIRRRRVASAVTRRGAADARSALSFERHDHAQAPARRWGSGGSTAGPAAGASMSGRARHSTINWIEQDHRGRHAALLPDAGFGSFESAARFCPAFDELRHHCSLGPRRGSYVPLAEQRRLFLTRWRSLIREMQAAETTITALAESSRFAGPAALRSDRTMGEVGHEGPRPSRRVPGEDAHRERGPARPVISCPFSLGPMVGSRQRLRVRTSAASHPASGSGAQDRPDASIAPGLPRLRLSLRGQHVFGVDHGASLLSQEAYWERAQAPISLAVVGVDEE